MKKILIFFLLIFCTLYNLQSYSQPNKRTNFWYFGEYAGLDFNNGYPVTDNNGKIYINWEGCAVMCDTNGNLLFYTDGKNFWDRNHQEIINGYVNNFIGGTQAAVIVPKPESSNLYYVFASRFSFSQNNNPFFYYTVNMELNNGIGGIIDLDTLTAAWDAVEKLTAVYHKNKQDIWVITRKFVNDNYAAFLVTSEGVNPDPVLSPAPTYLNLNLNALQGYMKVSYDKKYLVACYFLGNTMPSEVEVCTFNNQTGEIDYLYSFPILLVSQSPYYKAHGCEFSPDSKYLYISAFNFTDMNSSIYQFDMTYILDVATFTQSAIEIGKGQGLSIQLASDGKIYCSVDYNIFTYLGVIHKPWLQGLNCNYEPNAISLDGRIVKYCFPNFPTDYLFRFDFDGICESDTFLFDPWFFPDPTYIEWNFGDPASGSNNTSTIPHATHVFSDGGTYEVSVHVEYPSGRIEETSREVEVEYSPEPDLGPDTTICTGNDIILDAECGPHFYSWSTGQFGSSQITVSDTGWYWVRVTSNAGCFAFDSIYIGYFPPAIVDTQSLEIIPTTCGGSMGIIRGLAVSGNPPFQYQWIDDLGNPIANTIDIFHLPVGNYTLQVTDGNDCLTEFGPYAIYDAGDVLIENVNYTQEHCGQQDGSIIITATSGLSTTLLHE